MPMEVQGKEVSYRTEKSHLITPEGEGIQKE